MGGLDQRISVPMEPPACIEHSLIRPAGKEKHPALFTVSLIARVFCQRIGEFEPQREAIQRDGPDAEPGGGERLAQRYLGAGAPVPRRAEIVEPIGLQAPDQGSFQS